MRTDAGQAAKEILSRLGSRKCDSHFAKIHVSISECQKLQIEMNLTYIKQSSSLLKILHLDDDALFLEQLSEQLSAQLSEHAGIESKSEGGHTTNSKGIPYHFQISSAQTEKDYFQLLDNIKPDVVLLDINLGGKFSGDRIARETKSVHPKALIIMCTNHKDFEAIRTCIKAGADDFIMKAENLSNIADRIYGLYKLKTPASPPRGSAKMLIGKAMREVQQRIPNIVQSAITAIHVTGESGTGKELVSQLLEQCLPPKTPFIRVNCGAIAPSLLDSELFGHVKGAFTGADRDKIGLIEAADGGWIFFDELATLSEAAQISLLRVLESKMVRRLGGIKEYPINIKVMTATHENLVDLVQSGKFRQDLWQRLSESTITLMPLRNRMQDLPELIEYFCQTMENGPYKIADSALKALCSYDWREGNIRELRNCLRAMTEHSIDKLLSPLSLPDTFWKKVELSDTEPEPPGHEDGISHKIQLIWKADPRDSFENIVNRLLYKIIQLEFKRHGKVSIRHLSRVTSIPKSTLSQKLKSLSLSGTVNIKDLNNMIGIKSSGQ